jgi:asparagine N-glycosylation enzyme membrane subunit Stt3
METLVKIIGAVVLVILFFCVVAVLLALPIMLLWNWLIPVLFPGEGIAHVITFWQALGIALLCSCLFKSTSSSSSSK